MIALFDIGGTSIKYGVAGESRKGFALLESGETASNARKLKGPGIEEKVVRLAEILGKKHPLTGISISTAGMVDEEQGRILYANENIPDYSGLEWKKHMEARFKVPCQVENDVNAAALGEYAYGAGAGCESLLMLTVGTGIGGAIIQDGRILRGHSHSAGEIGYMRMKGSTFQELASTTALVRRAGFLLDEKDLNGKVIFERAKEGEANCVQAIQEICQILAEGIFNCVCLLNPEVVLLGGGIMEQKEYLRPVMDRCLREVMTKEAYENTRLEFASLKNQAGLAGAYYHFLTKQ